MHVIMSWRRIANDGTRERWREQKEPFACRARDQSFILQNEARATRIHTEEKPFVCRVYERMVYI